MILHILVHSPTFSSITENGVLETAEGNYLGPLRNFPRRCSNYSKRSRDGFIRIEVGQIRRACHASRSVLSRNAREDMREREREKYRDWGGMHGGERQREREPTEFRTVWCRITSNWHNTSAPASWLANLPLLRLHPEILLARWRGNAAKVIASIRARRQKRQIADLANFGLRWRETRSLFISLTFSVSFFFYLRRRSHWRVIRVSCNSYANSTRNQECLVEHTSDQWLRENWRILFL